MDLTIGRDRSVGSDNDEHHYRWQAENHWHVPGLRRITQTWPQGEKVVAYEHYGRTISETEAADLFRGKSIKSIARELRLARNTVRSIVRSEGET
jgi:hypothetical protein